MLFPVVGGGGGRTALDVISLVVHRGAAPFDCETQEPAPDRPVERGDVQVREGWSPSRGA